jgi:hypothetical protein
MFSSIQKYKDIAKHPKGMQKSSLKASFSQLTSPGFSVNNLTNVTMDFIPFTRPFYPAQSVSSTDIVAYNIFTAPYYYTP